MLQSVQLLEPWYGPNVSIEIIDDSFRTTISSPKSFDILYNGTHIVRALINTYKERNLPFCKNIALYYYLHITTKSPWIAPSQRSVHLRQLMHRHSVELRKVAPTLQYDKHYSCVINHIKMLDFGKKKLLNF